MGGKAVLLAGGQRKHRIGVDSLQCSIRGQFDLDVIGGKPLGIPRQIEVGATEGINIIQTVAKTGVAKGLEGLTVGTSAEDNGAVVGLCLGKETDTAFKSITAIGQLQYDGTVDRALPDLQHTVHTVVDKVLDLGHTVALEDVLHRGITVEVSG